MANVAGLEVQVGVYTPRVPLTKHKRKKELTSTAESGVGIGLDNEGTFAFSQQKTIPGNMSTTRADKRARNLKSDNF